MLWKEGDGRTSEGRMESKKHTFTGISSYRVGISIINAPYVLRMSGLMNRYSNSAGGCILVRISWEGFFTLWRVSDLIGLEAGSGNEAGKGNESRLGRDRRLDIR